jgi:23S rRNA (cytidine2498-2'-O)-methyltransferase
MTEEATPPGAIATAAPDSAALARDEIDRAGVGARVVAELAPGVLLLGPPDAYWPLAEAWRRSPPIFLRHLSRVQRVVAIPPATDAVDALRGAALDLADWIDPSLPFSVQTRVLASLPFGAYDVNAPLAEALAAHTGSPLDVRHPEQVLSVAIAAYNGELAGFVGVSPVA